MILAESAQVLTDFRSIEDVMAQLVAFDGREHRYEGVVTREQTVIRIDIEQLEIERAVVAQRFQRQTHVVAEVAPRPPDQAQARRHSLTSRWHS